MTKLWNLLTVLAPLGRSSAFVAPGQRYSGNPAAALRPAALFASTTVIPGTETETDREQDEDLKIPPSEGEVRGPVEWLIDDPLVSREVEDPFHILLLDETFTKNERVTIEYVASSCSYVLGMPYDESAELAAHAEKEGFSCLGTWSHEECLRLGNQLQNRDIVCRVVPFCQGGDRAWQARNARDDSGMKRAEDGAGWN